MKRAMLVAVMLVGCGGDADPSEPVEVSEGFYWDRGCVEGTLTGDRCDAFFAEEGVTIQDCQVFDFEGELGCCLDADDVDYELLWAYCQ